MFRNGIEVEAVIHYSSEIESLSLIRHDDGYFLAWSAAAANVYFCLWIFPIAVYGGICQGFAQRQLDIELSSLNTLRSFNQPHQTADQRRDSLNLAWHPEVDFQDGRPGASSCEPRSRIRCSLQACIPLMANASRLWKLHRAGQ